MNLSVVLSTLHIASLLWSQSLLRHSTGSGNRNGYVYVAAFTSTKSISLQNLMLGYAVEIRGVTLAFETILIKTRMYSARDGRRYQRLNQESTSRRHLAMMIRYAAAYCDDFTQPNTTMTHLSGTRTGSPEIMRVPIC